MPIFHKVCDNGEIAQDQSVTVIMAFYKILNVHKVAQASITSIEIKRICEIQKGVLL